MEGLVDINFNKADEVRSAKVDITHMKAVKVLLANKDIGIELYVGRVKIGLCDATNKALVGIVDLQIKEATKFIKGEKSKY